MKPEFWSSFTLSTVSRDARLLFVGLLNEADDEGRLLGSGKRLAGCLFPHDTDVDAATVDRWIGELVHAGIVEPYDVRGVWYLHVKGFKEHQRVNRPSPSKIPCPPGAQDELFVSDSANGHGGLSEPSTPGSRKKEEGSRKEAFRDDFEEIWKDYPKKTVKPASLRCYQARRREGISKDTLASAVANYAQARRGEDPKYTLQGTTFFGPNERWKDYLEAPSSNGRGAERSATKERTW